LDDVEHRVGVRSQLATHQGHLLGSFVNQSQMCGTSHLYARDFHENSKTKLLVSVGLARPCTGA
jgi:hypothetical protein